jgi:RimJ/RimL family protein N-acetyltransferase
LRAIEESDLPAYQKNFAHWDIVRNMSKVVPWPYPADGVRQFYDSVIKPNQGKTRWSWGIFLKEDPIELMGVIEIFTLTGLENRGFWLAKKHWGKGLMLEAVVPVTDFAFHQLGFDLLRFGNAVGNERSRRIKEKTLARRMGTQPFEFVDPAFTEIELWEMTRDEWALFARRRIE